MTHKTTPEHRARVAAHEASLKAQGIMRVPIRLRAHHRALLDAMAATDGSKQAVVEAALEHEAAARRVKL